MKRIKSLRGAYQMLRLIGFGRYQSLALIVATLVRDVVDYFKKKGGEQDGVA